MNQSRANMVLLLVLYMCLASCGMQSTQDRHSAPVASGVADRSTPAGEGRSPFTLGELRVFRAEVAKAEKISDENERCLAYPNPPGSHWQRDTVIAYCHYQLQPTLNPEFMEEALEHEMGGEIDSAIAEQVKMTASVEHPQDSIWRSLGENFETSSSRTRSMVDDWKRQSPRSALAYTASGYVYIVMAAKARGSDWARQTPDANFAAMHGLLDKAKEDLAKAVELDPSLSSAYALMVHIGQLGGDPAYSREWARRGLAVDPGSYAIYQQLARAAQPRWGGSRASQEALVRSADKESLVNPLLATIRAAVLTDVYDLDACDCATSKEQAVYRETFDQVGPFIDLLRAGENAKRHNQPELAFVYLSEAWRFHPGPDVMQDRQTVAAQLDP